MEMKNENEVTRFMYYIFNRFSIDESRKLFGENLGEHIFRKLLLHHNGLKWYAELDKACRQKLVDRANELYGQNQLKFVKEFGS